MGKIKKTNQVNKLDNHLSHNNYLDIELGWEIKVYEHLPQQDKHFSFIPLPVVKGWLL